MFFVPVFVAVGPIGIVGVWLGMTEGMSGSDRRRIVFSTVLTALLVSLAFMFLGKGIFTFLGISVDDFKIAGGIVLLLFALDMVLRGHEREAKWDKSIGVVPLGVPYIAGPATITTLLILGDAYPLLWVSGALVANLFIAVLVLIYSRYIGKALGEGGMTALSKIVGLFLAAIAVMMMRVGIQGSFHV